MTEVLTTALALGSVYALLGAAVALVSVATRTLHLAIGEVLVVGVVLQVVVAVEAVTGVPPVLAVAAAVLVGALVSAGLEPAVLGWFDRPEHRLVGLAVAAGVLHAVTVAALGARTFRPGVVLGTPSLGNIPGEVVAALALGIPGALSVAAALRWTRWGRRVRIAGSSEATAVRSGFAPRWLRGSALAVSGAAAVVAGLLVTPLTFVGAGQGAAFTVRGVAAALLVGRVGPGWAVAAGLLLGLVEAVATSMLPGVGGEVAVAAVVVVVLLARGSEETRAWGRAW